MKVFGNGYGFVFGSVIALKALVNAFRTRVLADGGTFEGEANLLNQSLVAINSAGFVYVPSAFKSGRLYSLKPTDGSGDLVFSRNSLAYRNNVSNVLEQMAANVGRINYVNGVPTLLMEPVRTNLLLQSQTLNTTWTLQRCTINPNISTAPDNTLTADKIEITGVVGSKFISQISNLNIGNIYTYSLYAKAVEETIINFEMGGGFIAQPSASFNLSTGTVISTIGCTAKITPFANGWYRCEFTTTTLSNATFDSLRIGVSTLSTTVGNGLLVWGVQQEMGGFSTSYMPTTTASVTRVGDSLSLNNLYTNNLVGINGGTWIIKLVNNIAMPRVSGYPTIFIGSNTAGSAGNIIGLYSQSSAGRLALYYIQNGAFTAIGNTLSDTLNVAFVWTPTSLKAFINGVLINTYLGLTWDITTFQKFITYSEITINMQYMSFANYPMSDTEVISRMS